MYKSAFLRIGVKGLCWFVLSTMYTYITNSEHINRERNCSDKIHQYWSVSSIPRCHLKARLDCVSVHCTVSITHWLTIGQAVTGGVPIVSPISPLGGMLIVASPCMLCVVVCPCRVPHWSLVCLTITDHPMVPRWPRFDHTSGSPGSQGGGSRPTRGHGRSRGQESPEVNDRWNVQHTSVRNTHTHTDTASLTTTTDVGEITSI